MRLIDADARQVSGEERGELRIAQFTAAALFCVLGYLLVRSSVAAPVSTWMHIYRPHDFSSFGEIWQLLRSLRVPIPPAIVAVELATYQITGTTDLVTKVLYRSGMIISYLIVICAPVRSLRRVAGWFFLSLTFLWGTVIIHAPNPQIYDVLYPLSVLAFLSLLRKSSTTSPHRTTWLTALGAGFSLTMAELLRPFFLFILPFCILGAYVALRRLPPRYFLVFLVPIVIFSGTWHLHLAISYGQLTWSNHSGFNLMRAWPMVEPPVLVEETGNEPLGPDVDQWENLNTPEHSENSRRLQTAVVQYIITHPIESLNHILLRIDNLLAARTSMYQHAPEHNVLGLYRLAVRLASGYLLLVSLRLIASIVTSGSNPVLALGLLENLLIVITMSSVVFLAIGDSHEEARFLISVLPLLAATLHIPVTGHVGAPTSVEKMGYSAPN